MRNNVLLKIKSSSRLFGLFAFAILLIFKSQAAFCHVQEYRLSNGFKILVKEDHRTPQVISMIWYNVGSADESGEVYGISHVLEHFLFKGTPSFPRGAFARKITTAGGEFNALTNNDYTTFYEKTASAQLASCLQLEADRMQNLSWDAKEFAKEIKIIQEERRLRVEDNPQATALERFLATAHLASPYQHPVIGWMYNLRQMRLQDAQTWYQRYYVPNNATLVVVGDVTPKQVYTLAKQYFGAMSPKTLPIRKPQGEPLPLGKKTVQIHHHAQLPILILGYTTPSANTAKNNDPYVLEIIAALLGISDTGRLSEALEHTQHLANATAVYYNLYARYATQFVLFAMPSQTTSLKQLNNAIKSQIKQLQTLKVSTKELQQAKTQIIAQKTFEQDSLFNQAMEIGMLDIIGLGASASEQYVQRIDSVTPEQIQDVAKRYFQENNLTEAKLITD